MIANKVVQRVRGVTIREVLAEMAKVRATGWTPNDWTGYMVWRMRNRFNHPSSRLRGASTKSDDK